MKLKGNQVKVLKSLHLLFAAWWVGSGAMMLMLLLTAPDGNAGEMFAHADVLRLVDSYIMAPAIIGILTTAVIYGSMTSWGFFKQRWITVKWLLTFSMMGIGYFALLNSIEENAGHGSDLGWYTENAAVYASNNEHCLFWITISNLIIFSIIFISVIKPWRKAVNRR